MPYSGSVNITIGDHQLKDVEYVWEDMHSPQRRGEPGWGMGIELPAVIDMVRLTADGVITASALVQRLEALAERIRSEYDGPLSATDEGDAWGADCPASGCEVCTAAQERFDVIAAETLVQRERLLDPVSYPYAAGKQTLHSSSCRQTREWIGVTPGPDDPWNNDTSRAYNLREFAHKGITNTSWSTHMVVLSAKAALEWAGERTGPRGGSGYKICKLCRPQLPQQ